MVTILSSFPQCPIHLSSYCFDDRSPFEHNIRLGPREKTWALPKRDHVFIYCITHTGTGMRYIGQTEKDLSARWEGHRSARKREKNYPLYLAMNECGLHMFVMEKLGECGTWIVKERELDYMRKLDTWNPLRGYNKPICEEIYARKLYFLLNPGQKSKYYALRQDLKNLDNGWREPLPHDQRLREERQEAEETSLREGRRLMRKISSLASPVILASPPSAQ